MTRKFLPAWVVLGALVLTNQAVGLAANHTLSPPSQGVQAKPLSTGDANPDSSLHPTAVPNKPAKESSNASPTQILIPKLPSFVGITLSGMDFAANSTENSIKSVSSKKGSKKVSTKVTVEDPFTLPPFDQTTHFLRGGLNLVKLPIAWESLQQVGGKLNRTRLETYTDVVATATSQGSAVIVTLAVSFERFTNLSSEKQCEEKDDLPAVSTSDTFIKLWGRLAKHFQHDRRVIFHLMAIPQKSPLPKNWDVTIQATVKKIRNAGAQNQIILPSFAAPDGKTFSTFKHFPQDFEAMKHIKNPDGTYDGILFDFSQTLGPRRTGSERCGGVNAEAIVQPAVELLKKYKRQAIVGTLAAGSEESCTRSLAKFAQEITRSYPHLAGFVLYGAGAFDETRPWALIKEGKFDSTHCSEEWVEQPNFKSIKPFIARKKTTVSPKSFSSLPIESSSNVH